MGQYIEPGTASSNITMDFRRTDEEYLVQITHWHWIVRMTPEQRDALSARLVKVSDRLLKRMDDRDPGSTWSITNISAIRDRNEPFSVDEYLKEVE